MIHDYDDIINLPHYEPKHHPRMSMGLSESGNEEMNRKMELIVSMLPEHPSVAIEYFVPDEHKAGGSYQTYTGNVRRIDEYEQMMVMTDGKKIELRMISNITITDNESNE